MKFFTSYVEVAYRKVRGRTMNVLIANDQDDARGSIELQAQDNEGLHVLKVSTEDGLGTAHVRLSSYQLYELATGLANKLGFNLIANAATIAAELKK
jgi:hypothetical protein